MPNREAELHNYPLVESVLNSIAGWVNKYRDAIGHRNEFGQCSPEDVQQIARDVGVSVHDLREMVKQGPHAADLLQKMLIALHVDPAVIAKTDPVVMRDLQRLCVSCTDKRRCVKELAQGTAGEHFHEFCPNAMTLDALFQQKDPPVRQ